MRSYTNSVGQKVSVSDEHIETAIRIYDELKRLSPSRRVNWSTHRKMMVREGFDDSDTSEGYRVLIKRVRYSKNMVEPNEKEKNLVARNLLESIKNEVGVLRLEKESARADFNTLNKLVRNASNEVLLLDQIKNSIENLNWGIFSPIQPVKIDYGVNAKKAVVFISDIHYGYIGENDLESYSPEIAKQLIGDYSNKVTNLLAKEQVQDVLIINLGDLVEGNLRNQSLFDTNKTLAQQAVEATDLVLDFINILSSRFNVSYTGIAGNHDRLNQKAKDNITGDNVVVISNAIIKIFAERTGIFKFEKPRNEYYHTANVNGINILAVHGDRIKINDEKVLAEQSVLFKEDFDILVGGHYHTFTVNEVSNNKYVVKCGSIKGSDDFSIKIGKSSCRSQGVIIIDSDKNFEIRQVKL